MLIAGVCGGIGEYFSVDPVIVRLIFVLVGLTTWGLVFPLYPLLWVIMPVAGTTAAPPSRKYQAFTSSEAVAERQPDMVEIGLHRPAAPARFDPITGEALQTGYSEPSQPPFDPTLPPTYDHMAPMTPPKKAKIGKSGTIVGIVLIGIGLMGITTALGIPATIVFPILLIASGILLLRR
jgi:phage shock protein C